MLTVREVAKRLGVCQDTIYRLVAAGKLPAIRVGSAIRLSPEAVIRSVVAAGKARRGRR